MFFIWVTVTRGIFYHQINLFIYLCKNGHVTPWRVVARLMCCSANLQIAAASDLCCIRPGKQRAPSVEWQGMAIVSDKLYESPETPKHVVFLPEILSPRGQSGLEAKILASASVSASKLWPRSRPWPQIFGLDLASVCSRRTSSQEETDQSVCRLQDITQWYM